MERTDRKVKLEFVFRKSDTYIETYATGLYGGLGPHGDLNIFFVEDSIQLPETEVVEIGNDGVANITNPFTSTKFDRSVKCKVTISPNDIPSMINWLQEKYDQYLQSKPGDV